MGAGQQEIRSGRRTQHSEINVTPFVDVMLVLLVIFMVTAPMMQQGIDVNLPETAGNGVELNEEPFTLVVNRDHTVVAGSAKIPIGELRSKLKAIFATRENKQIYLQADKRVDYGFVAEVMGEIQAAGIYSIGLVTVPKTN